MSLFEDEKQTAYSVDCAEAGDTQTQRLKPSLPYRYILLALCAVLLAAAAFWLLRPHTPKLDGDWVSTDETFTLTASDSALCVNGFCFPFERALPLVEHPTEEQPQGFVLDAGSMGALPGHYFFDGDDLLLTIDGQQKRFVRTKAQPLS